MEPPVATRGDVQALVDEAVQRFGALCLDNIDVDRARRTPEGLRVIGWALARTGNIESLQLGGRLLRCL